MFWFNCIYVYDYYFVDPNGQQLPLAIIQYTFLYGKPLPVKMEPHGNAKSCSHLYIRTQRSTLSELKDNVDKMTPKAAVHVLYDKAGGVTNTNSLSELPRDRRQAINLKSHNHCTSGIASSKQKDLVYDLLEQHFGSLNNFVRNVSFNDSVSCVLFTDQQLYDLERFCANTSSANTSVLGVDPTFNLGDFYVTVTTYENLLLINRKTGKHPVFIGPMLIHQRRTYENYFYFASELLKHRRSLSCINAVGTDGEEQLSKAFGTVFSGATKLLCAVHKRDNITSKLREFKVTEEVSKEILNSVFGYQVENTHHAGLIDSADSTDFQIKMEQLKIKWEALCPGFYEWFVTNEAEIFCLSLIRSARSSAGLGFPPRLYTTNNNESINRVLKEKISFRKQEWPSFNLKMQELILEQQEEYTKAVCGFGEYQLHSDYKSLEIPHVEWTQMTPDQRKIKVDKLLKHTLKNHESDSALYSECQSSTQPTARLSVKWNMASIPFLQPQRVEELWRKAENLLSTPGYVVPTAGNSSARQVASMTGAVSGNNSTPPHFVFSKKVKSGGTEVHCDCPVYSSTPKVCQHSLAAAEDMGNLKEYLIFLSHTKAAGLNISSLISKELPKSAGQKQSTSRRKGIAKGKKKTVLVESNDIFQTNDNISASPVQYSSGSENVPPSYLNSYSPLPMYSPMYSQQQFYSHPLSPSQFRQPSSLLPFGQPSSLLSSQFGRPTGLSCGNYFDQPTFQSSFINNSYCQSPSIHSPYKASNSDQVYFVIKFLEGNRIRSCYGCGNSIRKDTSTIPPPPHDLIIGFRERRYYKDPHTHQMRLTSTEENTYYHLMLNCVLQKHSAFQSCMLKVADSAMPHLQSIHRIHIKEQFNIEV